MEIQRIELPAEDRKLLFDFMGEDPGPTIDFNWLMPVVEKIEMLVTDPRNTEIGNSLSMWTSYHKVFNGTINTDIEVAYELIVEFIKWYNNQKIKPVTY